MSIENPTLAHFRRFSSLFTNLRSTPVENVRQITPFYAKQSQSQVGQNQPKLLYDKYICNLGHLVIQTNKANSNPIQTQLKPIQTQLKPIQTQNKPNSKPIQSQFKPNNQSSLITNHLEGKANFIFLLSQNQKNEHYIPRTRKLNNFLRCCYV